MPIIGFRIYSNSTQSTLNQYLLINSRLSNTGVFWSFITDHIKIFESFKSDNSEINHSNEPNSIVNIQYHTGTYDRNNNPIFEGDMLLSKTCETPFKVENIVDFLMMCGAYSEKNGCDIFDSLEIVKD